MKRDLRSYAKSTTFRLIIGGIVLLFILAFILIGFFYNWNAALLGILCIAAGLIPVLVILLILWVFGEISSRDHRP